MPSLRGAAAAATALLLCACGAGSGTTTVAVQGGPVFSVEVADDAVEREQGLSGRGPLDPGSGMLFTYQQADLRSFWMPEMLIPIDLAWINDGVIIGKATLQPCPASGTCEQHASPGPVDMVLEVSAGALDGVAVGTAVSVD